VLTWRLRFLRRLTSSVAVVISEIAIFNRKNLSGKEARRRSPLQFVRTHIKPRPPSLLANCQISYGILLPRVVSITLAYF